MPVLPMSITLPGVTILTADATGPQYSRWRRGLENAFQAKGLWQHCDGTSPMPMPESGPNFFSPVVKANPQPELLEERKAWMKKDREVKRDIFLSVSDDIKVDVFEVGPPLPPPGMNAAEMIDALDDRFKSFNFEEYHHAFCHFLNLHIDQYPSLEEFNTEFKATLDDLLDHGYPMDNVQACSAYFSKLRCTQNPWVAKKLKEWDTLATPPQLSTLMKECPPWMIIRPLATKGAAASQHTEPPPYTEQLVGTPSLKELDEASDSNSDISTPPTSGKSSVVHSRNSSKNNISHSRNNSTHSMRSQEITVHASVEDLTDIKAYPMATQKVSRAPTSVPLRLNTKPSILKMEELPKMTTPPVDRPLPPLPVEAAAAMRSRSASPRPTPVPVLKAPIPPTRPQTPERKSSLQRSHTKSVSLDQINVHPALRSNTLPTPPASKPSSANNSPNLRAPSTPEPQRPRSSQGTSLTPPRFSPDLSQRPSSSRSPPKVNAFGRSRSLARIPSNSSEISLPLQGVPENHDYVISSDATSNALGLQIGPSDEKLNLASTLVDPSRLSVSPPKSLMSRLSAELNDDDRKNRKRSWSIKAKITARRYEVKEII